MLYSKTLGFKAVYDNEENKGQGDGGQGTPPPKGFTQEEVNTFLAKERKTLQSKYEKRIQELETIRDSKNLSDEEVSKLNTQIEEMQNEFKTKEQLQAEEATRFKKQAETEKTKLTQERDSWKHNYTNMVIENGIVGACVENEAFNPDQVVAILKPSSRLVEVLEDNKPTGKFETKIKFIGVDAENKEVEYDLTPKEVVKKMTEMDKYSNLFKKTMTGGLGANTTRGGKGGLGDLKNLENYKKQRSKILNKG